MNFGTIKNTYIENYKKSLSGKDNGEGEEMFKFFLSEIKKSKTLKSVYISHNLIKNKKIGDRLNAISYLNESIKLMGDLSDINEKSEPLVNKIKEKGLDFIPHEGGVLDESIHNLMIKKRDLKNIDTIFESQTKIIDHLTREDEESEENLICDNCNENFRPKVNEDGSLCEEKICESCSREKLKVEGINPYTFREISLKKFSEKYKDLTESENELLKTLVNGSYEDKKILMTDMVSECVSKINEKTKSHGVTPSLLNKLNETKDYVYTLYSSDTNVENKIIKIYEIVNIL